MKTTDNPYLLRIETRLHEMKEQALHTPHPENHSTEKERIIYNTMIHNFYDFCQNGLVTTGIFHLTVTRTYDGFPNWGPIVAIVITGDDYNMVCVLWENHGTPLSTWSDAAERLLNHNLSNLDNVNQELQMASKVDKA